MEKINVYGTGVNAVNFVLSNKDIEIAAFIEGKKKDKIFFMHGMFDREVPVVLMEDAKEVLLNHYTVIATSVNSYWEIKRRLEKEYSLVEYENFEYFETYRKKIAIIYGNCHAASVKEALCHSRKFNSIYGFYPLKPIQEIKADGGVDTQVFERCDLFIHQCIRKENAYGVSYASDNYLRKLSLKCKVIGIPNLYGIPKFLFPQTSLEKPIIWEENNYFPVRDCYIDTNYSKMSQKELYDMLSDENLICAADIRTDYESFYEKVVMREKEWDVKIVDFLKKQMPERKLFYDLTHPTREVIAYITQRVLRILNMDDFNLEVDSISPLDKWEIPVYKAVTSALGFCWNTGNIRKFSMCRLNTNQMDLEEYIKQYIAWNFTGK